MSDTDFAALMVPVAHEIWGDPNKTLTTPKKICWGTGGSRTVSVEKGTWFDHENDIGGGVINLVMIHFGIEKHDALQWLTEEGFLEGRNDRQAPRPARAPDHGEHGSGRPSAQPEPARDAPAGKWTLVDVEPYTDPDGNLIYEVCRVQWKLPDGSWVMTFPKDGSKPKPRKTFVQRRPSGRGDQSKAWGLSDGEYMRKGAGKDWKPFHEATFAEWSNGERGLHLGAVEHTIFRHSQIEIAIADGKTILLPEGERKVRVAEKLGYAASCNSGGAKNWQPRLAEIFRGADVVIPVDNDDTGREAGEIKAASLRGIARRIRVLDFSAFVPGFPEKHDIVDWHAAGGTAEQLREIIDRLPDWKPRPPTSIMGSVGLHELHRKDLTHEFLIDDFLDRQGVIMMPGASGSGKTFLTIEIGMSVALGRDFWGMKTKPGLVMYQAGEGKQGVSKRLDGWMQDRGVDDPGSVPFKMITRRINLFIDDKDTDDLITECKLQQEYFGVPMRLLFVDTFNKAITGANENAGQDMTKVLARLERMSVELDCAVVVPIHKSAEGKMRGHTSLTGDATNVINVTELELRDQNQRLIRTVALDKNKDGDKGSPMRFVLRQVVIGTREDGKPITTCVVDRPNGDDESLVSEGKLSLSQTLFLQTLRDAIDIDGEEAPAGVTGVPRGKKVVKFQAFISRLRNKWPFTTPEHEVEKRKKEFDRAVGDAGKRLVVYGYVERDNDTKTIWWTGKSDRPAYRPKQAEPPPPLPAELRREIKELETPF